MFALEISFTDGVSAPETVFVRRPHASVGATEEAHVMIEDMQGLDYQLRLSKDIGRKFRCKPVAVNSQVVLPSMLEGVYDGCATIDVGVARIEVTALDSDLSVREGEPPDRAGVRVLRQACALSGPLFPAVVVRGPDLVIVSFVPDHPVYVGRSSQCAVRLDATDISNRHARIGFESGQFWIEDLGSTNGTFVNGQQVSGRQSIAPGAPIILGRDTAIFGVSSYDEMQRVGNVASSAIERPSPRRYPVLVSTSEVARPARLVLPIGASITVGRDPACDMWLGAPHVSRRHCEVLLSKQGLVAITDSSTNGTAYNRGMLQKGEVLDVDQEPQVLNFGGDLTVALCFDDDQEKAYSLSNGSPAAFLHGDGFAPRDDAWPTVHPTGMRQIRDTLNDLDDTLSGKGFLGRLSRLLRSHGLIARIFMISALVLLAAILIGVIASALWSVLW